MASFLRLGYKCSASFLDENQFGVLVFLVHAALVIHWALHPGAGNIVSPIFVIIKLCCRCSFGAICHLA